MLYIPVDSLVFMHFKLNLKWLEWTTKTNTINTMSALCLSVRLTTVLLLLLQLWVFRCGFLLKILVLYLAPGNYNYFFFIYNLYWLYARKMRFSRSPVTTFFLFLFLSCFKFSFFLIYQLIFKIQTIYIFLVKKYI